MAKTTFSPNTIAKSAEVNANFEGAYDGSLDYDNNRLELTRQDAYCNFVVTGLTIATSANLSSSILAGSAYVSDATYRKLVQKTSNTAKTFTASKDTYVDMDSAGTFYYVEVANGATVGMTQTSNTIRIAKVVTNGTAITSVAGQQDATLANNFDPLGNQIYNTDPHATMLGYGHTAANGGGAVNSSYVDIAAAASTTIKLAKRTRVRIRAYTSVLSGTGAPALIRFAIRDSSNNVIAYSQDQSSANVRIQMWVDHELWLAAGSYTYKLSIYINQNTTATTVSDGATDPTYIKVHKS